ncbi:beta-glucosidase [Ranunculus cassubicifolius]
MPIYIVFKQTNNKVSDTSKKRALSQPRNKAKALTLIKIRMGSSVGKIKADLYKLKHGFLTHRWWRRLEKITPPYCDLVSWKKIRSRIEDRDIRNSLTRNAYIFSFVFSERWKETKDWQKKRMTLEEKIGQMTQIERMNATADVMKNYFIGSVLSGGGSVPKPQATPQDWVNVVNDIQKGSLSTRLGIPMIYGIDAVHGNNNVYKATIFPHNVGLGVTRDPDLIKRIGAATALEVRATGIQYAFAPCIAVCRDPRWGRCYESYSEDPTIVQQMTELIPGLQGEIPLGGRLGQPHVAGKDKVVACAKHFVGDGGTIKGINENNTVVNTHDLFSIHMPAYYNSIIKGVATVMASYSSLNGVRMHANRAMLTDFLKDTLNFRGFVISDWQGVDRIDGYANYTQDVATAINAGVDMEHRELAREAVRKSLVLLKNGKSANQPLIPLPKKATKILIAGTHADNLGYQCGGWTIEWNGLSGNNLTEGTNTRQAIEHTVDPSTKVEFQENPTPDFVKSQGYEYAVVVVGELPYAETRGDSNNLTIPEPGPSIINNVCGSVKCVVVVISGRPLIVEPYLNSMDALVAAWLPGSEGQGVADVLFGDYGFTGRLARTWMKRLDQLPMNVGDANYDPLFAFGFGLTTKGKSL